MKGKVNYKQAVELMDYLIQNKTTTILLTGTTGESPTLSHKEEYELYRLAVKYFKVKHTLWQALVPTAPKPRLNPHKWPLKLVWIAHYKSYHITINHVKMGFIIISSHCRINRITCNDLQYSRKNRD